MAAAIRGSCVYSLDIERKMPRLQEAQVMVDGLLRQMTLQEVFFVWQLARFR
jgi:hypothetical protein